MYSTRIFSGAGIQTHASLLAMMLSFTVVMPLVILTLIPPSVVSPWFGVGFVPQDAGSNRDMHWGADLP
jgi:hypothetical protein